MTTTNFAQGTTTYGDIGQRTAAWAATEMLAHAEPVLVIQKFGMMKALPANTAQSAKFRRPIPYPAATTPLVEGVTPSPLKAQYEDVLVNMKQWGGFVEITDVVLDQTEDPVLSDQMMLLGQQAAITTEQVTFGIVTAGTSVFYTNGVARSSVNTTLSVSKQRAVTRFLMAQKAMRISSVMGGSVMYSTQPIEQAWIAVGHTDLDNDIRNLAGFIPTAKYGQRALVSDYEVGSVEQLRYILTPELAPFADAGGAKGSMMSTTGTNADVYPLIILGKEAFGCVPLKGKGSLTPSVVNPKPAPGDPLGQRGTVGWKAYFNAIILNQQWMARTETAATAL
jgi:N4-gp56 family major capsid protein